jgi:hypothetical protein
MMRSCRPVADRALMPTHAFETGKEDTMLDAIKKTLGLDEEGRKRREEARARERKEREQRVRQEAQAMKQAIKKK